jgi:long-chain fatty acid transport protein
MRTTILVFTILVPAAAHAGGYLIPSAVPREVGVGQAAVADQTGAEAVFLNTAALAGMEGLHVGVAGEVLSNRTTWSDPELGTASLDGPLSTPVGAAIALGGRLKNDMGWGVGIGFGVPAGGSIVWPDGWAGEQTIQSVKQQIFAIGGGVAFQPTPFLKLGASFVRFQITEELHQTINYISTKGDAALAMSGGGNGFGLAAEIKVPDVPLTFGVTYSHSAELKLEGNAHFESVPPAFQVMIHDQAANQTVIMPNVLFVGAAYEVMPNFKLMAAYEFERWTDYEKDEFIGVDGFSVAVERNYNNAQVFRLGGEHKKMSFLPELTLRGGVLRSISEQPTETLSPSLTDASSWAVSVGAGYDITPNLRFDIGYQHAFFDTVTATGEEAFPGTYETAVDIVSLGMSWRTDL